MVKKTTGDKIAHLTQELERLVIQQDKINSKVKETRDRVAILKNIAQQERQSQEQASSTESLKRTSEAIKGSGYFIGEQVEIRNPSRGQENQGTIIGKTRDNLLSIKTKSDKIIRRLPKNVRRT